MIFDGHNFNPKGPLQTMYGCGPLLVSTELSMSWPAVPCLACFSHFPPTATEHRLQVGQFLSASTEAVDEILSTANAGRWTFLSAPACG